jgi:hypothetical protein
MRFEMKIEDEWTVIDRWWTDDPVRRHFAVVSVLGKRACVVYDLKNQEWSIENEPEGGEDATGN